ncbi:uncharacterized protein [Chanodichthys erythropterus]|uniref:uncharacterized protein n=1 Tax=Chanodichthys erythropterus TaxID=933992 RepID=UPI00351E2C74
MTNFQEIELFPSDDEISNVPETPALFSPNRLDPPSHHISPVDRPGRRSHRSTNQLNTPRSRRPICPPPSRSSRGSADLRRDASHPSSSSSSSSSSAATPSVNALRQALSNAGIHFSRRNTKVQLHDLLVRSHQNSPHPPSNTQVTTQTAARSIRFASNPPQFQPASAAAAAAAAGAASSSATHSSRSIAAARNSSASSPTVSATFPPPTVPSNAVAMDPPPVSTHLRSQILAEIQSISPGGGPRPNPSSSLFRLDIPVAHPLKHLHTSSLDSIFHAISPRTLHSYWTAWRAFKQFHSSYNQPFPNFSLLSVSSFISYLNQIKSIQPSTIKVYLSGIQFFYKLIYGHPCPAITNPQITLLIKGIQKTNPTRPDSRQPLTIDLLAKCLTFLRSGHMPPDTARTLDAMFTLAFFGFLRVSEITTNSKFNPAIHPTFSDLQVLDTDTICFLLKCSKTDQLKNGNFIHIFNLPTPIQPYQSLSYFLAHRKVQISSPLDPLFIDENNLPVTRHWFQKKLKYILTHSGIQAHLYSSHSFRIGAATTAAQKGLPDHQIKLLGRWSSDAFQSYIRSDLSLIKQAHLTLASL